MHKLVFWIAALLLLETGCVISPRRTVGSGSGGGSNSEFTLSATPSSQSVTAGASATFTVTVQPVNGFTGTVTLNASAANSNVIASLDNTTINGGSGSANLTVQTTSTTPAGAVTITITASDTSNNVSQSATVTATVQGAATAGAVVPIMGASSPAGCVTGPAASGIQRVSMPSTPGSSGFTATFDATPSSAGIDAAFGLLSAAPGTNATLTGLIHFNAAGAIEVRDGNAFAASNTRYAAGDIYRFRLVGNLPAATYSVFVTPPGGTEIQLGTNLQMPSDLRGITALNGWGMLTNSPEGAVLGVCRFSLQ